MKSYIKISAFFMALFLLVFTVGCSKSVDVSKVKNGSRNFIECDEYVYEVKRQIQDGTFALVSRIAPLIRFESKGEFKDFVVLQDFNDAQKNQLGQMALYGTGMVELPEVKDIFSVRFDENEDIDYINWYGGDSYYYHNKAIFNGEAFEYWYSPATDADSVEEFINEKETMLKLKKNTEFDIETYTKNGVEYTSFSGKNVIGFDSIYLYWTYSYGGNKYWVQESIDHTDDPERKSSEYEYRQILVENSCGYSWIEFDGEIPFDITPEFLSLFEFYSVNFNA